MDYLCKTYVEFLLCGDYVDEADTREVEAGSRTISPAPKMPEDAKAFRYFDVILAPVKVEGQFVLLSSGEIHVSEWYDKRGSRI